MRAGNVGQSRQPYAAAVCKMMSGEIEIHQHFFLYMNYCCWHSSSCIQHYNPGSSIMFSNFVLDKQVSFVLFCFFGADELLTKLNIIRYKHWHLVVVMWSYRLPAQTPAPLTQFHILSHSNRSCLYLASFRPMLGGGIYILYCCSPSSGIFAFSSGQLSCHPSLCGSCSHWLSLGHLHYLFQMSQQI